jgi:predicted TIM-barrel fold metal-dependent hydrolase
MGPDDHYTIISADCHGGGSHEMYRSHLQPDMIEQFDAWREKYKNPFRDLQDGGRIRNWDDYQRNADLEADGQVAEIIFPNTVPPFFPSFVLFARPPKEHEFPQRLAGIRAHNRWMAEFCARFPDRRAGIGQIFLNDIDEAIRDVEWIAANDLRGGVLISAIAPDVDWVRPLYDPAYDPIWAACSDLGVPVNCHGGSGVPDYGRFSAAPLLFINEVQFYGQRPFSQLLFGGVFERFPDLKFVMTETGCSWMVSTLDRYDRVLAQIRETGRIGELAYRKEDALPLSATEYFRRNCYIGVSFPSQEDADSIKTLGLDRIMWGSDYPHSEGTTPFTREHLRQRFWDWDPADLRRILSENAAAVYGFDLDSLEPLAAQVGPTVAELAQPLTELPADANEALLR